MVLLRPPLLFCEGVGGTRQIELLEKWQKDGAQNSGKGKVTAQGSVGNLPALPASGMAFSMRGRDQGILGSLGVL